MILLSYDGSDDARAAIEQAGALFPGSPATVLSVWEPFVELLTRANLGASYFGTIDIREVDAASEQSAREQAAEGSERARRSGLDAQPHTRPASDTISDAILAEAQARDARAIVMGTRGLRGVKSLLLGSVSHAVVQHADRPVVVVPSPAVAAARAERMRSG